MKKKVKPRPSTLKNRKAKEKLMKAIKKDGEKSRRERASDPNHLDHRIGNSFSFERLIHGRDKFFASPEILHKEINLYFEHTKNNPMFQKEEWKTVNGKLKKVSTGLANVYTMEGLCVHLGVSTDYFAVFAIKLLDTDPMKKDFLRVIAFAKHVIYNQKFTGASSNTFNANLIAYDLGIRNEQASASSAGVIINIVGDEKDNADVLAEVQKKLADLDKDEK